jgi:ribosomal protein S18 acetylase RimI-like enzyme
MPAMGDDGCVTASVHRVTDVDDEVASALAGLLPQLSSTAEPLTPESIKRLVDHPSVTLLVARIEGQIVGTLTLVRFPLPTGERARIEDVVVDESARGQGVGAALTAEAVRLAAEFGARSVDLTSRPSRVAANRLYQRLGFTERDSRVYRFARDH